MLKLLYNILEKPNLTKYGFLVQKLIFLNIIVNILSFTIPFFMDISESLTASLALINIVTVILFIIELMLRYIAIGVDKEFSGFFGRLKYTFQFYTLVDIISITPFIFLLFNFNISYIRVLRLLRFVRILKLFRMQKLIKKFMNINAFASSHLLIQSFILLSTSVFFIYIFSYAYSSFSKSALIFLDPPQIAELHTNIQVIIGVLELIIGLFIGGALISIITSSLRQIIDSINSGYFTFKESNHIVIINQNLKLNFILEEINKYYLGKDEEQNIVVLLSNDSIEKFKKKLKEYTHIEITVIAGDTLSWDAYERVNINKADKIVLLLSEDRVENENKKISKYLISRTEFINTTASFVIETEYFQYSHEIYMHIFHDKNNHYTLVNNNDLIGKFLNRSVVNYDYFHIFSELMSFDGNEFYTIEFSDIFDTKHTFETATLQLIKAVLVGIIRNNKVILNPPLEMELKINDKLILIMEDMTSYLLDKKQVSIEKNIILNPPRLKEKRNICIVGNNTDIDIKNITQFLTEESITNIKYYTPNHNTQYMEKSFWDELNTTSIDVIILNIEDEYEFNLSLYLQGVYYDCPEFLSKIVNILHDPIIAMLLSKNDNTHSIILSQQLIGEFITQAIFNLYTNDIFDEITQSKGNELYILYKEKYSDLYKLNYLELKSLLLKNNMIYIGAFINNDFSFNHEKIYEVDKIVVLARGKDE